MIDFTHVTKSYAGSPILQDISFHIDPGEFVFITGKSGSGKTTVMRLLTHQIRPEEGTISVNGVNFGSLRQREILDIRRSVGVIYQDYKLLPERTVGENIALGLEIIGKPKEEIAHRVRDLLALVELTEKEHIFPRQLSGGEAQRICIARALATAPKVVFADEPTGNLDEATSLLITSLLIKLHELGTTIIMATHQQDLVKHFGKRTLHIENKTVTQDTPKHEAKKDRKEKTA